MRPAKTFASDAGGRRPVGIVARFRDGRRIRARCGIGPLAHADRQVAGLAWEAGATGECRFNITPANRRRLE